MSAGEECAGSGQRGGGRRAPGETVVGAGVGRRSDGLSVTEGGVNADGHSATARAET